MKQLKYDDLSVVISDSEAKSGEVAAEAFAKAVNKAFETRDEIAVILATGNSQLAFIDAAVARDDIDWSRITVLHMDEYLGMDDQHPASFRKWMVDNIVNRVPLKKLEGMRGDHEPYEEEIQRYTRLLEDLKPVVCVMGIGENGHLAFNDPPADFNAPDLVRLVEMDEVSRRQQVGEGHFPSLEEAPTHALSMSIPALLAPETLLVVTPEARKAEIVRRTLTEEISPMVPATILRNQPHATLFLDADSSSELDLENTD